MESYTYLIGWSKLNKWYYGVRYANKIIAENDLWVKYFTSSRHVKNFRKIHGEPDIIKIRKKFNRKEKAIEWEIKVLKRMKILYNEKWLNKNICKCIEYTDDIKAKISKTHKGKIISEEHKKAISEKMTGYIFSDHRNNKISEKLKGVPKSEEHKRKLSEKAKLRKGNGPFKGKKHSEETKTKIKETKRRKRELILSN
jgi:hypothetical protein